MDDADRIFFETTRRLAPQHLADHDVTEALALAQVAPGKPVADLGCGFGRHLLALRGSGHPAAVGIDRSELLLREAARLVPGGLLVRADLRALPLHGSSLSAAFCFYSSMFLGSHGDAVAALREAARVLRPGGSLVLTQDNPVRLAAQPRHRTELGVPGLGRVVERSRFDPAGQVDRIEKELHLPRGQTLCATFAIRYYAGDALGELARSAGLSLIRLHPDAPLTEATPQLVALLEKPPQG